MIPTRSSDPLPCPAAPGQAASPARALLGPIRWLAWVVAMLAMLAAPAGSALAQDGGDNPARVALVIDNRPALDVAAGAESGGQAMAAALEAAGFTTTLVERAAERKLYRAFDGFVETVPEGALVVVYFAGRGGILKGRLVPFPTDIHPMGLAPSTTLDDWMGALTARRVRGTLWLVDAGFSAYPDPATLRVQVPHATCVAFATLLPSPPLAGSRFTTALLAAMEAGVTDVPGLLREARLRVIEASGGQQVPWEITNGPPETWQGMLGSGSG